MDANEQMKLWNTAVRNAGGTSNTVQNFRNIMFEFNKLALAAGMSRADIDAYITDNYQSTCAYFN